MPVHAGPRPIQRVANVTMFDRIQMNVIAIYVLLLLIAYAMLPIARLPDAPLLVATTIVRNRQGDAAVFQISLGEPAFDVRPAHREVVVALRQGPNAMQMIRQQHASEHVEPPSPADLYEGPTKQPPRRRVTEKALAAIRNRGEEIRTALLAPANVIGHDYIVRPSLGG